MTWFSVRYISTGIFMITSEVKTAHGVTSTRQAIDNIATDYSPLSEISPRLRLYKELSI